ncbi:MULTISPECIES: right-handed parallel beta-helix repeat-containing protein [unclassified Lentimicrobium]|uniref:right-handed parallel beta-helix repeat-containing protein n=1 Tax=unclassified Lentimicrobium TaxID=2677434 RepID=UPI0015550F66|nr:MULTISPECIES: T9SS type A sorting domain-containing protein [unclassified Lentimicrobium]NPD46589.1 T9SS type A sorting domain-containing protein [Lentimicrobium sp. S6]NPD83808.1 T9SS type A sorting domain-containing protein [Lentimicrobium sp. L6]
MKHSIIKRFLFISILMAFASFSGHAGIIYVNSNLTAIGDGNSWPTAYKHLQDALDAAVSGDEIWVVQGTYYPDLRSNNGLTIDSNDPLDSFNMITGVQLLGGFIGNENYAYQRTPDPTLTIFSGQINTNLNSYHVVSVDNAENVIIDGLTIRDGFAKRIDNETIPNGGAIIMDNESSVYINQVYFTNNKCEYWGAAIQVNGVSYANINNCIFEDNNSEYIGGAISIYKESKANISNSTFTNNSSRGNGGAIHAYSITLTENNPITIDNCTFTGNKCKYPGTGKIGWGGAIDLNATITGSEIYPQYIVSNCKFYSNEATGPGGAVSSHGSARIENCLFVGNESEQDGGGLYVRIYWAYEKKNRVNNCTFFNNTGANVNSMFINSDNPSVPVKITNSILWGSDSNPQIGSNNPDNIDITYSNIKGDYEGIGNIDDDPQLTMDYHLAGNSPSLNTGNNYVENLPEFDLDGNDRIICSAVDMGAYETVISECDVIHVNWDVGIDPEYQDGDGWLSAYDNLQSALDEAEDGDQIWIAAGTYKPSTQYSKNKEDFLKHLDLFEPEIFSQIKSNQIPIGELMEDPRRNTFRLDKSIAIYGGFYGDEISIDERNQYANETILSGNIDNQNSHLDNCYSVVSIYNDNSTPLIDGLTISDACRFNQDAGSIRFFGANLFINNCKITNNYTTGIGCHSASNLTIQNSIINYNNYHGIGAGLRIYRSNVLISNCKFEHNYSEDGGGALRLWGDNDISQLPLNNIKINHTIFANNIADGFGGAIINSTCKFELDHCTFYNNIGKNGNGNAIWNDDFKDEECIIKNSIFWNPTATEQLHGSQEEYTVKYSDVQLLNNDPLVTFPGTENINTDPFFVNASNNDFHLQTNSFSSFGTPLLSNECSPCIDAGNPSSPYDNEPSNGNNSRVNMGIYGNTEFAANPCVSNKETKSANAALNESISNSEISISPNPFSENMNFNITSTEDSNLEIYIYNSSGQQVKSISSQIREGQNQINWDGNSEYSSQLPKGIYLAKIKLQNKITTKKIVIN